MDATDVIALEASWKRRLQTREHELNRNPAAHLSVNTVFPSLPWSTLLAQPDIQPPDVHVFGEHTYQAPLSKALMLDCPCLQPIA